MTRKVDEVEGTEDGGQDVKTSDQTSKESKTTSQSTTETQEKTKDEAKLISDKKAEEGRKLKLEELQRRLEVAEAALQKKQDEELAIVAGMIGKTPEELKALGLDTADKVKQYAEFFGVKPTKPSTQEVVKPTLKVDTGKTVGGTGELTPEMVAKMPFDERFKRRDEIAKLPLNL